MSALSSSLNGIGVGTDLVVGTDAIIGAGDGRLELQPRLAIQTISTTVSLIALAIQYYGKSMGETKLCFL